MTEEQRLIRLLTQALKDIIGAADNNDPYSREELFKSFQPDYHKGYEYLQKHGISEIS